MREDERQVANPEQPRPKKKVNYTGPKRKANCREPRRTVAGRVREACEGRPEGEDVGRP